MRESAAQGANMNNDKRVIIKAMTTNCGSEEFINQIYARHNNDQVLHVVKTDKDRGDLIKRVSTDLTTGKWYDQEDKQ